MIDLSPENIKKAMAESIQDQKRHTLKVGDTIWSDYFNATLTITEIYSDSDWYFELNGKSYKAQTTLSYIENHPLKPQSIQDQKRVSQKEPIFEVTVKMKNGEEMDVNPVVNITIDNTYHEYDFNPREIESITFKEVEL